MFKIKPEWKQKLKYKIKLWSKLVLNWRFLVCFGLAWIITNGWSYILLTLGLAFKWKWVARIAATYIAFLWLPITPEKVITVAISLFFVKNMFPNHNKTLKDQILNATDTKIPENEKESSRDTDTDTDTDANTNE